MATHIITIVIPTYNRAKNLRTCLESCQNLHYDRGKFEILVIDDGSSDDTASKVREFSAVSSLCVRYLRNERNIGIGASRNAGVKASESPYMVFIDDDVLVPKNWLKQIIAPLQYPQVGVVGGPDICPVNAGLFAGCVDYAWTSLVGTGGIRRGGGKYLPRGYNMSVRREVLQKLGLFRTQNLGEDIEFSNRARANGYELVYCESGFVYHHRRITLADLTAKIFMRGVVRMRLIRGNRDFFSLALLLPPALVVVSVVLVCCAPFSTMCCLLSAALLFVYGSVIGAAGIHAAFKIKNWRAALLVPVVLVIQHYSYGAGLIIGKTGEKYPDH